jgi:TetR/AcrR family transcriptional repressor of nem operon
MPAKSHGRQSCPSNYLLCFLQIITQINSAGRGETTGHILAGMNSSIRLDKRDLILAKGAEVMTRRGYHGAGVQEIVQAAGVPKGSFYHYFASKEDFALQALQHVYQPRLARYAEALSNPALSPRERILGYYAELVEHFARQERLEYHCFIGSLSFEMADLSPTLGAQVDVILQTSADILQRCLQEAQAAGELAADEDCRNLAGFIANAWQGALTRLKVANNTRVLTDFIHRLQRLLQA